ncbi:MAG: primosomal protein N' [Bacteroidetes bacterium]|nr:primosomal protein N' [Bacteroidota bacterium]
MTEKEIENTDASNNIHPPVMGDGRESDNVYAEIIIPFALPKNYTWSVPDSFRNAIKPGARVEVMLKNKRYAGIIKKIITQKPEGFEPKPILNILDDEPQLHAQQLQLWQWIADYYMCSEGEVMQAAMPANLKLSSETILVWNEVHNEDFSDLNDREYIIAEALNIRKELKIGEVQQLLDASHVYPVIKSLIEKNVCHVWEELKEKYKEKTETYIVLHPQYHDEDKLADLLNSSTRAPKQMELLLSYLHLIKEEGEVTQPSLLKKSNASAAQLKGLMDKNILFAEKRSVNRIRSLPKNVFIDFTLSSAQQNAFESVQKSFEEKNVCLLHGITASGKTQIYIKLMEQFIRQDKQVLYMLPEIALTAQVVRRLQKHFGGYIAVYHSKFNANERVEIWNRIKSGELKVLLGARSALFLPFNNLGLIIADEEHDASYKQQDPAPRYHARDAAVYYVGLFHAKILLGSATPSIESYYNTQINKYALVELKERFGDATHPSIDIIDISKISSKEKVLISEPLKEAIAATLAQRKQIILFQNRRGYTPYLICNVCGWIPQCRNCDVTLTYHKAKNKMLCHYCGTEYPVLYSCPQCGSHDFKQRNFGTEKIEELVAETFEDVRIARMDYDTMRGKNNHDTLIKLFEQQKIDLLVGTQMIVKGLDFEHVNLVGILDADSLLYFADFRVNERAFQLMEQVSGRAGRKDNNGKVMIQVSNIYHPVLKFVMSHDYKGLYDFDIQSRKQYFYPPFTRLIHIRFRHKENHIAEEAANIFVNAIKKDFENYITGPAQPVVNRLRNKYLWDILLKLPKHTSLVARCKKEIEQQTAFLKFNKRYRSVDVIIDIDPV